MNKGAQLQALKQANANDTAGCAVCLLAESDMTVDGMPKITPAAVKGMAEAIPKIIDKHPVASSIAAAVVPVPGAEEAEEAELATQDEKNILDAVENLVLGGRHRDTKVDGTKYGTQSHHPIADDASDISTNDALAIRMDKNDHIYRTGNWGSRRSSKRFRAQQKRLVQEKNYDEALNMGINDIKEQNPGKYDTHIEQMLDSAPKKHDGSIDWIQFKRKKEN